MLTETYDVLTASDRTVAVWRNTSPMPADGDGPVVVLAPGFGLRMRSSGVLAQMLVHNGATVHRFDSLDHVGISEGEIDQFCLSSLYEALAVAVDDACRRSGAGRVTIVATSLAALASLHFAAVSDRVARIVLMLGVVNGRNTLRQVLGADYFDVAYDALPDRVLIDKHWVDPRPIYRESRAIDWWNESATVAALNDCDVPVRNFVAQDDDWVDITDVRRVFGSVQHGHRPDIVEIAMSGHALLRNPVALMAMMTDVTRSVLGVALDAPIAVPSFGEIVALRGAERELEKRHSTGRATRAVA